MTVLASAQMSGCRSRDRTTLQGTDASQMNATDVMLAEPATAHGASMVDENVPDAPPSPSSDYSRVIEALAGSARTPYMLTIPAQLAAMLRARIGSGKLAPHRPIPGEPARPGSRFFKPLRQTIESISGSYKGQLDLERHGGKTPQGVLVRILQRILALTAAIWHNDHSGQPITRSLLACDH